MFRRAPKPGCRLSMSPAGMRCSFEIDTARRRRHPEQGACRCVARQHGTATHRGDRSYLAASGTALLRRSRCFRQDRDRKMERSGQESGRRRQAISATVNSAGHFPRSGPSSGPFWRRPHNLFAFNRSALPTTLTDDNAIAAAAMIGDSSTPNVGYRIPAAIGTPAAL